MPAGNKQIRLNSCPSRIQEKLGAAQQGRPFRGGDGDEVRLARHPRSGQGRTRAAQCEAQVERREAVPAERAGKCVPARNTPRRSGQAVRRKRIERPGPATGLDLGVGERSRCREIGTPVPERGIHVQALDGRAAQGRAGELE